MLFTILKKMLTSPRSCQAPNLVVCILKAEWYVLLASGSFSVMRGQPSLLPWIDLINRLILLRMRFIFHVPVKSHLGFVRASCDRRDPISFSMHAEGPTFLASKPVLYNLCTLPMIVFFIIGPSDRSLFVICKVCPCLFSAPLVLNLLLN